MKKKILVAAVAVAIASVGTSAFAATTLGGATQKGSLLIFPRVEAETTTVNPADPANLDPALRLATVSDTLISITNDSNTSGVQLQCYWNTTEYAHTGRGGNTGTDALAAAARTKIRKNHSQGFTIPLGKNATASFWAGDLSNFANGSYGIFGFDKLVTTFNAPQFNFFPDGANAESNAGELKCWATNQAGDKEIHFNHLYGRASIFTFGSAKDPRVALGYEGDVTAPGQGYEYNAWAFQARLNGAVGSNDIKNTNKLLPTPGSLKLDGKEYDQCPSSLAGNFVAPKHVVPGQIRKFTRTQITVASCHEDLRQDADAYVTKLTYGLWDAHGNKKIGNHECMGAWYEADLGDKFPAFSYAQLKTDNGSFRAVPTKSNLCNDGTQKGAVDADVEVSGVVGIQVNDVAGLFQTGTNLTGLGGGTDSYYTSTTAAKGEILWDATTSGNSN